MDNQPEIQTRIPKNYEPEKYTLEFTVDPFTLSYSISLSVDIYVTTPSKYLILNALMDSYYTITSLSLQKYDCISDLHIEIANSFLQDVPEHKIEECIYIPISSDVELIPNNKLLLTIQLKGSIQIAKKGFFLSYFSNDFRNLLNNKEKFLNEFNKSIKQEGNDSNANDSRFIKEIVFAAINEPVNCRTIFPCFDEPCYKAIFSFKLRLEKAYVNQCPNLKCVTNGNLIEVKEVNDSYFEFAYSDTPIMSSYLFTLVIGSYDFLETKYNNDVKIRVFTPVNHQRDGSLAMELAHKSIKYYESYFAIPYMHEKMDLICIPTMEFRAIENWGCIVFLNNAMLFSHFQCLLERILITRTIVHEISHMWFGNLVTMEWWNDIWLNEGFARIFEFLCCMNIMPEYPFWDFFCEYVREDSFVLDENENTHPVKCNVPSPRDMDNIFDHITYSKGANIIRMLYEYIGEDLFKQSIRVYLKKYQYQNTTTEDLWNCFNETTNQDIGALMNSWLDIAGHPVVDVDLVEENSKWVLKVNQKPFINKKPALWTIPLFIKTIANEYQMVLKDESMVIPIESKLDLTYDNLLNRKDFIIINSNMKGYYRVDYKSQLLYNNIFSIKHHRITSLDIHSLLSYKLVQRDYCGCIEILNKIRPITNKLLLSYSINIYSQLKYKFIPLRGFESLSNVIDPLPKLIDSFFIGLIDKSFNKKDFMHKLFINDSNSYVYKDQFNDEYEDKVLRYLCLIGEDKEMINYIIDKFNTEAIVTHKNLKLTVYEIVMRYTYAYTKDREKEKKYFNVIYEDYNANYYSNSYYILRDFYSALCAIEYSSDEFIHSLFKQFFSNIHSDANSHYYSYILSFQDNKKRIIDMLIAFLYEEYSASNLQQSFIEYAKSPFSQGQNNKSLFYKNTIRYITDSIKDKIPLQAIRDYIKKKLLDMSNNNDNEDKPYLINELKLDSLLTELIDFPIKDPISMQNVAKEKEVLTACLNSILSKNID